MYTHSVVTNVKLLFHSGLTPTSEVFVSVKFELGEDESTSPSVLV